MLQISSVSWSSQRLIYTWFPRLLESPGILFSIFKGLESPGKWNDPGKWSWNSSWCFLKMLVEHASIRHLWQGSLFKILIARLNFHPKMCQKCLTTGLCPEPTGGSLSAPQDLATVVSEGVNTLSHYVTALRRASERREMERGKGNEARNLIWYPSRVTMQLLVLSSWKPNEEDYT